MMNFLTAASDRSSSGLSFSVAAACCALCSSALAAFAITWLQVAPVMPVGHQGAGELLNGITPSSPLRRADGPVRRGFLPGPAVQKRVDRTQGSCCPGTKLSFALSLLSLYFGPGRR